MPQSTTRGDIALNNQSGRIRTLERHLLKKPDDLGLVSKLAGELTRRAHFSSRFEDFSRLRELTESLPERHPGAPALLVRARARATLHRFEEAWSDLEQARAFGATDDEVGPLQTSIQIARGRDLPAALAAAKARAERAPTLTHLASWAAAEAALGEFASAEDHYQAALRAYPDVSPFPVAQLMFQRALMWAELADDPARARPMYAEAVRRLPGYVVANVHLAELEIAAGEGAGAQKRLSELVAHSDDPEALGLLAELRLAKDPNDAEANALLERARSRYDALLSEHRAAFLDHAAEFLGGPGKDAPRALRLALDNLELRPTPRAHELVIEVGAAANNVPVICHHLERATPLAPVSRNLASLIAREAPRCAPR